MSERTPKPSTVKIAWLKAHPFSNITEVEEREAEFDRMIAEAKAEVLEEFERELIDREMPEYGSHINMTKYREGLVDGVNRSAIAASRRAAAYRTTNGEEK